MGFGSSGGSGGGFSGSPHSTTETVSGSSKIISETGFTTAGFLSVTGSTTLEGKLSSSYAGSNNLEGELYVETGLFVSGNVSLHNRASNCLLSLEGLAGANSAIEFRETNLYWSMGHRGSNNSFFIRDSLSTTGDVFQMEENAGDNLIYGKAGSLLGINTDAPTHTLTVAGAVSGSGKSFFEGDMQIADNLFLSGNLGVGTSSTLSSSINVIGGIREAKYSNGAGALASLRLAKAKGSEGSPAVVSSGHSIGQLEFAAFDGANYIPAAAVKGKVEGTPGADDMPGALHFETTADGAKESAVRLVIDPKGNLRVGTDANSVTLNANAEGALAIHNGTAPNAATSNTAVLYVDSGELKVLDAGNNTTVLSPHPDGSEDWVFYSKNLKTGKTVKIQMQKLMKKLNDLLGEDLFEEWHDDIT